MNDKYNPIDITWEDFETYLPDYQFDEKQIQFFKDTLEMILIIGIQVKSLVLVQDVVLESQQ